MKKKNTIGSDNWQEIIRCINKHGKWTGKYLTRKEMSTHKEFFFNTSFAWFYDLSTDEVLFEKRTNDKFFNPGQLGIVGGHVEKDEGYLTALQRESIEEINVDLKKMKYMPIYIGRVKPNGEFRNFCYFYLVPLDKKLKITKIQKEELNGIIWYPFDKYIEDAKNKKTLMEYKTHKGIFKKIKKLIKKIKKDVSIIQ